MQKHVHHDLEEDRLGVSFPDGSPLTPGCTGDAMTNPTDRLPLMPETTYAAALQTAGHGGLVELVERATWHLDEPGPTIEKLCEAIYRRTRLVHKLADVVQAQQEEKNPLMQAAFEGMYQTYSRQIVEWECILAPYDLV